MIGRPRVVSAAAVIVFYALLLGLGELTHPRHLGVPGLSPSFSDLRSVTTGWECTRRGIDVLALNPCDPFERSANYPRIWMLPSVLGIGEESTVPLGFLLAAGFFLAALLVVPRRARSVDGLVYGVALCSPAVFMGVYVGNVDLAVFALVVLAILMLRHGAHGPFIGSALLLFAAMLKLFPIFAVGVLTRQRRRAALLSCGAVLGGFAIYLIATLGDIRTIGRVLPQYPIYSYGMRRVTDWVKGQPLIPRRGLISEGFLWGRGLDVALILLVLAVAIYLRRRLGPNVRTDGDDGERRDLDLFVAGAGIYVGTYMWSLNFNYRLVFLLLAVPQLLRWARRRNIAAIVTLLALIGTLWLEAPVEFAPGVGWVFRQWNSLTSVTSSDAPLRAVAVAQLILFAGLSTLLVALVPPWRQMRRAIPGAPPGPGAVAASPSSPSRRRATGARAARRAGRLDRADPAASGLRTDRRASEASLEAGARRLAALRWSVRQEPMET